MSLAKEQKRLLTNLRAYKESLPPPPPVASPDGALLPNDKSRADQAIRTRSRRYGDTKLTKEGKKKLSNP